jgi:hypothetical protein
LSPLSPFQLAISLHESKSSYFEYPLYNVCFAFIVDQELDNSEIGDAFFAAIEASPSLRTKLEFDSAEFSSMKHICKLDDFERQKIFSIRTVSSLDLVAAIESESSKKFDLTSSIGSRLSIFEIGTSAKIIVFSFHHLFLDGMSAQYFFETMSNFFAHRDDICDSNMSTFLDESMSMQLSPIQNPAAPLETSLKFWNDLLRPIIEGNSANLNFGANPVKHISGRATSTRLEFRGEAFTENMFKFLHDSGCTIYQTTVAAVALLSTYLSQTGSVCIGSVHANRTRENATDVGCFVNGFAFGIPVDPRETFMALARFVKDQATQIAQHWQVPWLQVLAELEVKKSPFQIMVNGSPTDFERDPISFGSYKLQEVTNSYIPAIYDVTVQVAGISKRGLVLKIECSDALDPTITGHFISRFKMLFKNKFGNNQWKLPMNHLDMTLAHERKAVNILNSGYSHSTASQTIQFDTCNISPGTPLPLAFDQIMELQGHNIALSVQGREISYSELLSDARNIAANLEKLSIGSDDVVALCMEQDEHWIACIMGTNTKFTRHLVKNSKILCV